MPKINIRDSVVCLMFWVVGPFLFATTPLFAETPAGGTPIGRWQSPQATTEEVTAEEADEAEEAEEAEEETAQEDIEIPQLSERELDAMVAIRKADSMLSNANGAPPEYIEEILELLVQAMIVFPEDEELQGKILALHQHLGHDVERVKNDFRRIVEGNPQSEALQSNYAKFLISQDDLQAADDVLTKYLENYGYDGDGSVCSLLLVEQDERLGYEAGEKLIENWLQEHPQVLCQDLVALEIICHYMNMGRDAKNSDNWNKYLHQAHEYLVQECVVNGKHALNDPEYFARVTEIFSLFREWERLFKYLTDERLSQEEIRFTITWLRTYLKCLQALHLDKELYSALSSLAANPKQNGEVKEIVCIKFMEIGRFEEALEVALQPAVKEQVPPAEYAWLLSSNYLCLQRPQEALQALEAVPESDLPRFPPCQLNKVVALLDIDNRVKACQEFILMADTQAKNQANPDFQGTLLEENDIFDCLDRFAKIGELDFAFEQLQKWYDREPQNVTLCNNYAYTLAVYNGDLQLARQLSEKSLQLLNERPAFMLDTLAWICYREGNYREALKLMLEAEKQNNFSDDDGTMNGHLGEIYEALGDLITARKYWERAVDCSQGDEKIEWESRLKN